MDNVNRAKNVGIIAIELYFPSECVNQRSLEEFDNVSSGKYTIGLGQEKMGFCSDNEDINSICLTVVNNLFDRLDLSPSKIGRLEVGTETIVDKSKSVKSVLMQLFSDSGNHDVEGVDSTNACYGGTAALFNSIAWMESSAWDGRFAIVVAGDIAVYSSGNARCTGGAGAIAILLGPNASLCIENGLRASHMMHVYDFYKPDLSTEYPTVDGQLSIKCYLRSLDSCYMQYLKKNKKTCQGSDPNSCGLHNFDAMIFHSPYCKLVQKSLARLAFIDYLQCPSSEISSDRLYQFKDLKLEDTYFNKEVEKTFMAHSKNMFEKKTLPSLLLAKNIGNMYTASLYFGLASWFSSIPVDQLNDKRIGMFSYGSGSASTFYVLKTSTESTSNLKALHASVEDLSTRLDSRKLVSAEDFTRKMIEREEAFNKSSYQPMSDSCHLFPKTWFLCEVDEKRRRKYSRKSRDQTSVS